MESYHSPSFYSVSLDLKGRTSATEDASVDARVETQRRRHSENMSRYRHKTKAALNDMRKRVLALHATQSPIYQSSYRHLHQHQRQDYGDKLKAPQQLQRSPSPPSAMEHVLLEKDRLGKASATFTRPSRDDMENNNRRYEDSQDEHKPRPNDNLSRWVSFVEGEALFYYTPLATVQCLDMVEFRLRGIAPSSVSDNSGVQARVTRFVDWTVSL